MKTSEHINELAAALAKAQGTFTNPPRNRAVKVTLKAGGNYTFHYTTLDCIIDMIRPGLSANGLSFVQSVGLDTDWVIVGTRLMHSSGQWIEDELPVKPDGFGPQQIGSAITYGKRYLLTALLGVASDEDDDGNLGSGHTSEEMQRSPPPKRNGKKSEVDQLAEQHGMTTGDKVKPLVGFDAAIAKVPDAADLVAITKGADWLEKEITAKRFTTNQGELFADALAERAIELCNELADFEAADKIIRTMAGKMRISDPRASELRIKLADAKEAKCGAAA